MSGRRRTDELVGARLHEVRDKGTDARYCVIGAGNGGLAMAGHLGILGYRVALYNRTEERLHGVRWHGGVKVAGAVSGFGPVPLATADMAEAVREADVVMVVTPATAHRNLAALMAPYLRDGQLLVLNPGRTGGALEVRKVLAEGGCRAAAVVAETQTFLYASRATSTWEARIYRVKNANPLATIPSYWIPHALGVLNGPFPQFVAGSNVLATSLENIGAVFHPALTILNAGWIEATHGEFDYYLQGITPAVAKLLERIDGERLAVASALGVRSISAREWLYVSYDSPGRSLYEAIKNTQSYRGIRAPQSIAHRYVSEDVPMSLVPISSLGAMLGVRTPITDMIIDLGSILHDTDYRAIGRTTQSLGLEGLSVRQIQQLVGGVRPPRPRKEQRHD